MLVVFNLFRWFLCHCAIRFIVIVVNISTIWNTYFHVNSSIFFFICLHIRLLLIFRPWFLLSTLLLLIRLRSLQDRSLRILKSYFMLWRSSWNTLSLLFYVLVWLLLPSWRSFLSWLLLLRICCNLAWSPIYLYCGLNCISHFYIILYFLNLSIRVCFLIILSILNRLQFISVGVIICRSSSRFNLFIVIKLHLIVLISCVVRLELAQYVKVLLIKENSFFP